MIIWRIVPMYVLFFITVQFPHLKSFVDNQVRGVVVIKATKLNHREQVARMCHLHNQQDQRNCYKVVNMEGEVHQAEQG